MSFLQKWRQHWIDKTDHNLLVATAIKPLADVEKILNNAPKYFFDRPAGQFNSYWGIGLKRDINLELIKLFQKKSLPINKSIMFLVWDQAVRDARFNEFIENTKQLFTEDNVLDFFWRVVLKNETLVDDTQTYFKNLQTEYNAEDDAIINSVLKNIDFKIQHMSQTTWIWCMKHLSNETLSVLVNKSVIDQEVVRPMFFIKRDWRSEDVALVIRQVDIPQVFLNQFPDECKALNIHHKDAVMETLAPHYPEFVQAYQEGLALNHATDEKQEILQHVATASSKTKKRM